MKKTLVLVLVSVLMGQMAIAATPQEAVAALKKALLAKGEPSIDESKMVTYGTFKAPTLMFGKRYVVNDKFDVVDEVKANKLAEACTVFVKGSDDNFIRVSTNIMGPDSKRCMGTELKKDGPVYPVVMKGENYTGAAEICKTNYDTYYEPIKIKDKVVGIYLCGNKK